MEKSLDVIFKLLTYKPADDIRNGTITRLEFYKQSGRLIIDILFNKVPLVANLAEFNKALKTELVNNKICKELVVNYNYASKVLSPNEVKDYYLFAVAKLAEKNVTYIALDKYKDNIEYGENRITLKTAKGNERKYVEPLYNMVAKSFNQLGIDFVEFELITDPFMLSIRDDIAISISTEVDDAKRYFMNLKEDNSAPAPVEAKANSKGYKPKKPINKINGKVSKIRTIPLTESDMVVYNQLNSNSEFVVEGVVSNAAITVTSKGNYHIYSAIITDDTDSIMIKTFVSTSENNGNNEEYYNKYCMDGNQIKVYGYAEYDKYSRDIVLKVKDIISYGLATSNLKIDDAKVKRVELHAHSKMTYIDSVLSIDDYFKRALQYGHKAFALTDKNSVQGLGELEHIYNDLKDKSVIKPIYGMEAFLVDEDEFKITFTSEDISLEDATFVVYDFETTGLSPILDDIIEIGACKIKNGEIIDKFQSFVKTNKVLTKRISDLTTITNDDLRNAPTIDEILPKFKEFFDGAIMVAHNASFDNAFLLEKMKKLGIYSNPLATIDTMTLAMARYQGKIKKYGLEDLCKYFYVSLDQHHRAIDDAVATGQAFIKMVNDLISDGFKNYNDINKSFDEKDRYKFIHPNHVLLLAKNRTGLVNMNRIISDSHCVHFHRVPRLTKKFLEEHREGLLVGSCCSHGEMFENALRGNVGEMKRIAHFFDFLEVQPISEYTYIIEKEKGDLTVQSFIDAVNRIITVGDELGIMVVATGDVHELDPEDKIYRKMLYDKALIGGGIHELNGIEEIPSMHYRTTQEMLDEFDFLPEKKAYEIVVENTNKIADMIEQYPIFPKKLFSPSDDFMAKFGIPSAKDALVELVYNKAHEIYGDELPKIVEKRLEKEINSILTHDFGSIYYIAYLLVKHSRDLGYVVGSRGSVGSSIVAFFAGVTEVNSLPPHYVCPNCKFSAFKYTKEEFKEFKPSAEELQFEEKLSKYDSGLDAEVSVCPHCGQVMHSDGCNIPFETFLGFEGDKTPDIDLNFSGEVQPQAHSYCREIFGVDNTYRGGTIQTIAKKIAENYVKDYYTNREIPVRQCHVAKLAPFIDGVKRSTGQHPGGIVVVPEGVDVNEITPYQYPADKLTNDWKTTHIDYHKFENNLLKLDILGHDDPTMVRFLMEQVSLHPDEFPFASVEDIPITDRDIIKLFNGVEVLGVTKEQVRTEIASNGLPEFGTSIAKTMLQEIRPQNISALIKISGLAHGTNVWSGNARDYFFGLKPGFGKIPFEQLICCRDDIMIHLIEKGLPAKTSFKIMESVRKGKGLTKENETLMRKHEVEEWFIDCCKNIKYLFPRAHAAAYVTMALRIAWFKLYKPLYYYAGFFTKRVKAYEVDTMVKGYDDILKRVDELSKNDRGDFEDDGQVEDASQSEGQSKFAQGSVRAHRTLICLQVALEMYARGYHFLPVDINKSHATDFVIEGNGLRIPFVAIDQFGENTAKNIMQYRGDTPFSSIKDAATRGHISPSLMEKLQAVDAFNGLPREDEIGIFRFLKNDDE